MALHVDLQVSDSQMLCLSLRGASQYRPNSREQFGECKRLNQIIVCAELESFHTVAHTVTRSQKENGCTNVTRPQLSDDLPSAFLRQHDVNDQKIKLAPARFV